MPYRLIHHSIVDSSSERAFASLESGEARDGDVHIARGQTAGRGQRGRGWHSAADEGLYMSLVLRPGPPIYSPAAVTIAVGLAVLEALNDLGLAPFTENAPRLKWPNDVMIGEAKICGILTESRGLDPKQPHYVIGLGLNVRQRQFPQELLAERQVTSLARLGLDISLERATEAVLGRLEGRLGQVRRDHRQLANDYLMAAKLSGKTVRVTSGKKDWIGIVHSMSLSDGLELMAADGDTQHFPLEFVQAVEQMEG